jgi:pimeloyl-ACP methyl ester carboxylesterase
MPAASSDPSTEPYPRETPADPEGRFVNVAGGPAHVVIDGDLADPIVAFVHGIPGNTRDARYLGPALARRGLCCVRVDMPGFGKTALETMPLAHAAARADFVVSVLRALGASRFAVAGHSIGGAVALAVAARHRAHISALLLLNSVGVMRHRGLVVPTTVHKVMHRLAASPLGDTMARRLERYYSARSMKTEGPLNTATFAHHIRVVASLDFLEQRRHARAITAPVLLFSTDDDVFIQPFIATSLRDALTHAPRVCHLRTPRGGHHGQKIAAAPIAEWCAAELRSAAR